MYQIWKKNLLQYRMGGGRGGGLLNLLQYYIGEAGVCRDPKFVLCNKWTAPKGSEDSKITQLISERPLNQTAVSKIRRLFRRQARLRKGRSKVNPFQFVIQARCRYQRSTMFT